MTWINDSVDTIFILAFYYTYHPVFLHLLVVDEFTLAFYTEALDV